MFVDIDSMKLINDRYGHDQGDLAIKTVASSISESITVNSVAVRYGGDEFLVIIPDCDRAKAISLKKAVLDTLRHKNSENELSYSLTASIGFVTTDPEKRKNAGLKDYVREADTLMYEIKKEMHARRSEA